jgi:hypothetical protein
MTGKQTTMGKNSLAGSGAGHGEQQEQGRRAAMEMSWAQASRGGRATLERERATSLEEQVAWQPWKGSTTAMGSRGARLRRKRKEPSAMGTKAGSRPASWRWPAA